MVSLKSGAKTEADRIKNESARVFTTLYINFSEAQGQITLADNSGVSGGIWPKYEIIQAYPRYLQE